MKPNRKPDFTWRSHDFWCEPEMKTIDNHWDSWQQIVEKDGVLCCIQNDHAQTMREEIQTLYLEYLVESLLLDTKTDSKSD